MKSKNVLLILIIFIPIFLQLFISPYGIRFIYVTYIFLFFAWILYLKNGTSSYKNLFKKIAIINFFYILILLFQMIQFLDFSSNYWKMILPFLIVNIILFYFIGNSDENNENNINQINNYLIYAFCLQFILSLVESFSGKFLVSSYNLAVGFVGAQGEYYQRFIIQNPDIFNPFNYLKIGLSGLYGQHNLWALQLPFYNLIFLILYFYKQKKMFLYAAIFVFVAQLLNTTRTSLALIALTDIIFYFKFYRNKSLFINSLISILGMYFLSEYFSVYAYFGRYLTATDTWTVRLSLYYRGWDHFINNYTNLIWGMGYKEQSNLVLSLLRPGIKLSGFENGFLDVIFMFGIIGILLYFFLLITLLLNKYVFGEKRFFLMLLVIQIIALGFTLSHIFQLHVYPFVILSYLTILYSSSDNQLHASSLANT